jgi:Major Facilitator Superfamily
MLNSRWTVLGVLFLARTAMGFQFQSVASTAPDLIADFGLNYAQIGTLIGFYSLPGVLMAFPSGLIGKRFGDRTIYVSGLVLMASGGTIMGLSHDLAFALTGRLLSGAGAVLFGQALTKMVTDWFAAPRDCHGDGSLPRQLAVRHRPRSVVSGRNRPRFWLAMGHAPGSSGLSSRACSPRDRLQAAARSRPPSGRLRGGVTLAHFAASAADHGADRRQRNVGLP